MHISEAVHYPVSLSKTVTVPQRTVTSVVTLTDIPEPETKIMYKMITADDPPDPGEEEIETLEKAGVIVQSVSPWARSIVIVPKKTAPGEPPRHRMCKDYCILNSLLPCVDKAHSKAKGILTLVPIPKINVIYVKLEGSMIYSTFDMHSGYYHLELTLESQSKSAFVVGGPRGGKWEFKRCPFRLTQVPAYFQLLVSKVIEGLSFAFGYLDDILVFSANIKEHLEHIRILFQRLTEVELKLSKRKYCFLKVHVQYLGHYISRSGLKPVPEKLENLKRMPPPTDVTGVRKFLGFVGYYRKFIPWYSDIARPLTNLTRKDEVFNWSGACQGAFEMLKEGLLKEPILKYPDPRKLYVLYTDASKYAWAGVLTQSYQHKDEKGVKEIHHPNTYISGLFRGRQINWVALVKEAYVIYMSTRKLDYYLDEAVMTIRSDHLPLKRFLEHKTKNSKVDNWSLDIAHYNLQLEYVKGTKNTLADTMSRLVQLDPAIKQEPELEGYQFSQPLKKEPAEEVIAMVQEGMDSKNEPIPPDPKVTWGVTPAELKEMQSEDKLCT